MLKSTAFLLLDQDITFAHHFADRWVMGLHMAKGKVTLSSSLMCKKKGEISSNAVKLVDISKFGIPQPLEEMKTVAMETHISLANFRS